MQEETIRRDPSADVTHRQHQSQREGNSHDEQKLDRQRAVEGHKNHPDMPPEQGFYRRAVRVWVRVPCGRYWDRTSDLSGVNVGTATR